MMMFMIKSVIFSSSNSKVIAAEGEHKASRALRHAADVISENPAALQVMMMLMMVVVVKKIIYE